MNTDKIRENIERGVYNADKHQGMGTRHDKARLMRKAFRDDLETVFGTKDWITKEKIWDKAWENGHYAGYSEVLMYYKELVEFNKDIESEAAQFRALAQDLGMQNAKNAGAVAGLESKMNRSTPEFELKTKPIITYGGKQIAPSPAYIKPSSVAGAPQDWLLYLGAYYSYYINDLLSIQESSLELEKKGLRGKVGGEDRPPCGAIPQRVCLNAGRGDNDQTWCENAREIILEAMRVIFSGSYIK